MFYCKIASNKNKKIAVLPVLIALIMLSQGSHEVKSKLIVDNICKHAASLEETSVDEVDPQYQVLSRNSLNLILVTVVSVALIVLPIFASDYPSTDRTAYLKILVSWPKKLD
jgi:hypothetical protein